MKEYFIDHLLGLVLNLFSCFLLSMFLVFAEVNLNVVLVIVIVWILTYSVYFLLSYYSYQKEKKKVEEILSNLEEKYLITSLLEKPKSYGQRIYYDLLEIATRSMNNQISEVEEERANYQEYIENWVHEIKTPIVAIDLISKNENNERLKKELDKIDFLVEQTLFYARSDVVEKDYFIHLVKLEEVVHQVLLKHRSILLENQFEINVDLNESIVYTDEKWLEFILNQLISNSIKYSEQQKYISFSYEQNESGVILILEDHGIGISPSDLPKVFEKGFTGKNRLNNKSTGIGLYLAYKLSNQLGLVMKIDSELGQFTKVSIFFPKGTHHKLETLTIL